MRGERKKIVEYDLQIGLNAQYPFKGLKSERFAVSVIQIVSKQSVNQEMISKILELKNEHMININKVIDSEINQSYSLFYEYVPFSLQSQNLEIRSYITKKKYKKDLSSILSEMLSKGIKPQVKAQIFGFTNNFQLKMFVKPNSQFFNKSDDMNLTQEINALLEKYETIFEREQIKNTNLDLKNKLANLSQKVKNINIHNHDHARKSKRQSSSERSDSLAKTGEQQRIGNGQWRFDSDFHFEDSHSEQSNQKQKKKRTSSFKVGQVTKNQNKQKKTSWNQQRNSVVESDKTTLLRKRVSDALAKTQKTLTKYQQIRSQGRRKSHCQAIAQQQSTQ